MKLSEADFKVLDRCRDLIDRHGADGMFPRGGQHKQFLRLADEGLLRYVGLGADIEGESGVENHHVYEITVAGRNRLAEAEAARGVR